MQPTNNDETTHMQNRYSNNKLKKRVVVVYWYVRTKRHIFLERETE